MTDAGREAVDPAGDDEGIERITCATRGRHRERQETFAGDTGRDPGDDAEAGEQAVAERGHGERPVGVEGA
jgi:hypothetical protein